MARLRGCRTRLRQREKGLITPVVAGDTKPTPRGLRGFLAKLGPGLVTGAADDDPSGIGTYSIVGAQFGFSCLWTAWFSFPLMAATQLICARLGQITGRGLGGIIRERYGYWVLWPACVLLAIANVVNIGADLGAMAASGAMMTGISAWYLTPVITAILIALMLWSSYHLIAKVLKWLTLVLFSYIAVAFLARPNWGQVLHATLVPQIQWSGAYMATLVAIFGTTISPYLFFWQAMQEVEEERDQGKVTVAQRRGATETEKRDVSIDVIAGMLLSNAVMYFIVLATGATLHVHGHTHIATTEQAAEALRPLAGKATYLLFTLGIIGTGMLSIPVLAGSTAYAIAEGAKWRNSLKYKPGRAPQFYAVLIAGFLIGLVLNYVGFGVVAMLYWSAVLNGVLAPPLIILVVLLSSDRTVMGENTSRGLVRWLGWLTAAVMTAAAIAMFVTLGKT